MKKVLLTGMAGFIASEVGRQLLKAGVEVVGIDNFNDYYDPRLKRHRLETLQREFRFDFRELDIENAEALQALIGSGGFDAVFNLAARAGVGPSVTHPHLYYQTNLTGTLNLLQAMVQHQVPKLVLASTSSVYAGEPLPFREDAAVNRPISPYSASKKAAEQIAYTYNYHFGISTTVVRYFTVYGPAGRPDMSIFRFMRWIDEGSPLQMLGDGQQSRDFTYVEDIARGTVLAASLGGYEVVNLGGGRSPVSMLEAIAIMEKGLGKKAKIEFKPAIKADIRETQADISKARRLLGWSPAVDVAEGLDKTLQWYLKNRDFVRGLKL